MKSTSIPLLVALTLLSTNAGPAPALLIGAFEDDYGIRYTITDSLWTQGSNAHYRIVKWDTAGRFLIAQNESQLRADPGQWTRIDWVTLPDTTWKWAFCYSTWNAATRAIAETVSVAKKETPKTGCNGFPFSRMTRR